MFRSHFLAPALCFVAVTFGPQIAWTQTPDKQEETVKAPSLDLSGVWDIESGTRAGEEVPQERLSTEGGVTFDEKTITLPADTEMVFVMSYKVNSETSPAQIDMAIKSGPAPEGAKALGIVKFSEGKLTLCYDSTGEKRPEKFQTSQEDGFFMFTLKKRPAQQETTSDK